MKKLFNNIRLTIYQMWVISTIKRRIKKLSKLYGDTCYKDHVIDICFTTRDGKKSLPYTVTLGHLKEDIRFAVQSEVHDCNIRSFDINYHNTLQHSYVRVSYTYESYFKPLLLMIRRRT